MIGIYRGDEELVKVPICQGCKVRKELMSEDSITLVFTSDKCYKFLTGDYTYHSSFGKYVLTSDYFPTYENATGEYKYNIKFDATYYAWNNHFLKLNPKTGAEISFSYNAFLMDHVNMVLENIEHLGFKGYKYFYDSINPRRSERKTITYDNVHILDALTLIAETFECEWWIYYNTIYFGDCYSEGREMVFKLGETVSKMTPSTSSADVGTRLYVYGSDKNLPINYRNFSAIDHSVSKRRLMLPEGIKFLDSKDNLTNEQVVEFVKTFDIYPRMDGKITSVKTRKIKIVNKEDNTETEETRYRFQDKSISFSKDYLLNEDLTVRFSTGKLAGMDFAVKFNPDEVADENKNEAQWFEIIPNEDYGFMLPDDTLYPKEGDEYHLLNWDSAKIEEFGLVKKAEEELLQAGREYLKQLDTDGKTYTCTLFPHIAKEMYSKASSYWLKVGDKVIIENESFFPNGLHESRIIAYELNLDYLYDNPVFTIGQKGTYSRLKTIETSVEKIVYKNDIEKSFGTGNVHVLSRTDQTLPSDRNVFSSLRSQIEFLKKNSEDTAKEKITFEKGLYSKMVSFFETISSTNYSSGFTGEGFLLGMKNGLSKLEVDELVVRQVMTVFELIIQKIRSVGGQIIVSAADGKIKEVVDNGDSYFITFEDTNYFRNNDLVRCQTFTGTNIKMYWVEVLSTNNDGITVLKSEFKGVVPMPGDECVLMGNTQDTRRQNLISISATEDGQPRIDIFNGVNTKNFTGCLRTRLGNLEGVYDEKFGENQPKGYGLYSDNAYLKGEFIVKSSGQSVDTMFAVTDGKIQSAVTNLQNEVSKERNFLQNGSFTQGLKYWVTSNDDKLLMSADNFLLDNDSILYDTVSVSCEPLYDNIHYVTLKGTNSKYAWIREAHYNFIGLPEFESGKDYPLVIRFNYRAKASGLAVFHKGTTFPAIFSIAPTDEFVTKTIETTWNGTGDFELRSNTEIDIYGISIYTETTEAKYRTFFDQSEKFIKFGSTHIDNDGNILNGAEVRVETEGDKSGTYIEVVYQEGKETKRQTLGEFSTQDGKTKVKFSGDNVILEGDVTANGKVQIREDGSLVAHNGYFTGILANQFLDVTKDNFYNIFENVSTEENHNSWEIKKEYFSPFIRFWYYPTEDETGKTQFPRFRLPHFKFSKWSEDEVFCLIGKMFYVVDKSGYDNINGKLKVVYITGYGAGFTNEVTEYPQGFYMCRYKNGVVYYEHINEI